MLSDDQRSSERDHHQNAKQSAKYRDEHYARDLEIESENKNRRHRDADSECDGFTGRAGGLDDVVLENRCVARAEFREEAEDRDRYDGNGNRRADRESDFENEVER